MADVDSRMVAAHGKSSGANAGRIRLGFLAALLLGGACVLVWRLWELQVRDTARYSQLASEERNAQIPIVPRRGSLLDARGNPLAVSVMYDSLYAMGPLITDPDRTAAAVAPLLGVPVEQIRSKLDRTNKRQVVLRSRVPSSLSESLRKLDLPGVYLAKEPIRQYPEGSLAAQVLGFVGHDFKGLAGLEVSYDDELAGVPGVIDTELDTVGQEIVLGRRVVKPPVEGADLVLTLDRYVQRSTERILADAVKRNKASGGLILIMEPDSGSIIAAASNPTFSLTEPDIYKPELEALYKATIVTNQFEPGSTMKVLTMASAIEERLVNPGTTMNDTGLATVGGALIRNWDGAANGQISMTQILIKSSNVGTSWVSGLLGAERFYRRMEDYGFGQITGVRLPGEAAGTLRTAGSEGWTRVDLATNSYGQGVAVTPLQLLSAVASIGNDGVLMRPRLVREIRAGDTVNEVPSEAVRPVMSPSTARTLREMMVAVAQQDGLAAHRIPGYRIALKTGTADTPTNLGYDTSTTFASVVALLPADEPRFAVLVRLDGPEAVYGGVVAAPVLKQVAEELFAHYRIPPTEAIAPRPTAPPR